LTATDASGTGLGLSIVKRIATLHAGLVAFDETTGAKGLRVTVSFGRQSTEPSDSSA